MAVNNWRGVTLSPLLNQTPLRVGNKIVSDDWIAIGKPIWMSANLYNPYYRVYHGAVLDKEKSTNDILRTIRQMETAAEQDKDISGLMKQLEWYYAKFWWTSDGAVWNYHNPIIENAKKNLQDYQKERDAWNESLKIMRDWGLVPTIVWVDADASRRKNAKDAYIKSKFYKNVTNKDWSFSIPTGEFTEDWLNFTVYWDKIYMTSANPSLFSDRNIYVFDKNAVSKTLQDLYDSHAINIINWAYEDGYKWWVKYPVPSDKQIRNALWKPLYHFKY